VLGHPEMAKDNNDQRHDDRAREMTMLTELLRARTAEQWERFLEDNGVPAARVRTLPEALADPQLETRGFLHRHANVEGVGAFTVPNTPFKLAHGGGRVTSPPRPVGADTEAVLRELGYEAEAIGKLRDTRAI
jgi:crotonobetainyl-CoA:carnitine CoA-transferase CaiB-like acyl-CoA transferase